MKKVWILVCLLLVLCMVSCGETDVIKSDEQVGDNVTATGTPVPTATSTPVPTATGTPTPTATSTPVPTATGTPVPTATSTPVPIPDISDGNVAALVFSLPDCKGMSAETVWLDSEMNLVLQCPADLFPKEGKLTVQFAYPCDSAIKNKGLHVEVFAGTAATMFSPVDCPMVTTEDGEWSTFNYTIPYELTEETCEIIIKTHSEVEERGIPFVIAGLQVETIYSGEKQRLDLLNPALQWTCRRYRSGTEADYEWIPLQLPAQIPTTDVSPTETPMVPEIPPITAEGTEDKYITYCLPESEDGWHAAWEESECNIIMMYTSEKPLSDGTVYARLYIPKLPGAYRNDAFELAIHAQDDFMNFSGDRVDVSYSGNEVSAQNKLLAEKENHYEIVFAVPYDSSKVANGKELKIIFKSHCDASYGAYEVSFCDVIVVDEKAGEHVIDFSKNYVRVVGKMYSSGETLTFRYTKEPVTPGFYVTNMVEKLPVGYVHQLGVNTSGKAMLHFSSSDPSIATVDAQGKIITHKQGQCTFTVTDEDTGESKSFTATIDTPRIIPVSYEILMIAGSSAGFEFNTEFATKEGMYQYHSSNTDVVSVEADGRAKAHAEGSATITVTDTVNGVSFEFELEVYAPEDPDGVAKYLSLGHTNLVTVDIAKRSYDLIYAVYRNVFDYFNHGEYESVVLNFTVGDYSPAYSNMVDIFLASEHMLASAKDVDCITHELIHCAQNYPYVEEQYVWVMEGLTDYGRYMFGLHNEDCGWHLTEYEPGQHYTNSYTVTANFFKYITENHCSDMPTLINEMFKHDGYRESIWKENTGFTLYELWNLYANSG